MRAGWLCAGIFAVLYGSATSAAPLEVYGKLPSLEDVAVSPDGTKVAYVTDVADERTVLVATIADRKLVAALRSGNQKLRDLQWADNDRILVTVSRTSLAQGVVGPRQEYLMSQVFTLSTKRVFALMDNVDNAMNVVAGPLMPRTVDGHTVVFLEGINFANDRGVLSLFSVDLDSHRTKVVAQGSASSNDWVVDDKGNVVAAVEYDERSQHWDVRIHRDDRWSEAYGLAASIETPDIEGLGPDGASVLIHTMNAGKGETLPLNLADGTVSAPLKSDIESPIHDPVTHRVIGSVSVGVNTEYQFFSRDDQGAWNSIAHAFPGENVELVSWSDDRQVVVVRVDGKDRGSVYQLIDRKTSRATEIGPTYVGIDSSDFAEVQPIVYKAADGRDIPAYLTLPIGKPEKNLPLIVLAHGGPASRDMPEFDWWSQALASRGYAVLQPEFRGSDGFGWEHLSAGFGEWGRKMQTDLSDGVRYLAGQGTIDPKRVCIIGASYGGYAALAGATIDRGVYRCAVAVAGLSDLHGFLRWRQRRSGYSEDQSLRYWERFMGATEVGDDRLDAISPLTHAKEADCPVLLIHGKDDTVVPYQQSEEMEDALKNAGKPVSFVTLDSEDHWLSRSQTRLQMLQASVAFLEANNPPN